MILASFIQDKVLQLCCSSVQRIIKKWKICDSVEIKPPSGRPTKKTHTEEALEHRTGLERSDSWPASENVNEERRRVEGICLHRPLQ